jgi:enoyl-[acyl-carrier protein] reductase I
MSKLMEGKKGIILGLANDKSIAWGIAEKLHEQGATIGFSYLNDAIERRVRPLAAILGSEYVEKCDVQSDDEIKSFVSGFGKKYGQIDFIVHSLAFADKTDLNGGFVNTSRKGFALALDISAYSLIGICREALPYMVSGSSVVSLTYLGSTMMVEGYDVMGVAKAALESCNRYLASDLGTKGIRVNTISAGPIKTLAASGVPRFRDMLKQFKDRSAMQANISQEDVGKTALYLLSDLSSGVTGDIHFVDAGYHNVGFKHLVNEDGTEV